MRLVNVCDVIKAVDRHTFDTDKGLCLDDDITCILEDVPTAEKERAGRWIDQGKGKILRWLCSGCGREDTHIYTYCPDCGIRMRNDAGEWN